MKRVIIVRYCEIHLKGKNRGFFKNLLVKSIQGSLKHIKHNLVTLNARYLITDFDEADFEIIAKKLEKISGIHSYSPAYIVKSDLFEIKNTVLFLTKDKAGDFKVETNRADKTFPLNSIEVSRQLGGDILDFNENLKVNVINPKLVVSIDIREGGQTLVYVDCIKCLSGMPIGSAGHGMLMLSGGIDSPVAGFMMAKRGMTVDAVHFFSYPYTSELAKEKVISLAKKLCEYTVGLNLYMVSFTEIQEEIHKLCPEQLMITLMRRFMMRISEILSKKVGAQAIITGESLGQVASQTIENITSSNSVVKIPVLRPLIAFDKLDIIEVAKKIDTFETSTLPYEDCCTVFLPKFPAIKPKMEDILRAESALDVENLIMNTLNKMEVIKI